GPFQPQSGFRTYCVDETVAPRGSLVILEKEPQLKPVADGRGVKPILTAGPGDRPVPLDDPRPWAAAIRQEITGSAEDDGKVRGAKQCPSVTTRTQRESPGT